MTKKSRDRRKYLRWKKRQVYAGEFITMSIEELKQSSFNDLVIYSSTGSIKYDDGIIQYKRI